jgi:hypothetical protein
MRKLITVLALSTFAFAGVSIYLWKELREARDQVAASTGPSSASHMPDAGAPRTEVAGSSIHADQASSASTAPEDDKSARQRILEEDFRDAAHRRLAQLSDSTMRAQILEEWKEANLPNKPRYARYLGISESEAERLIETLADLEIAKQETYSRCTLQPGCDFRTLGEATSAARRQTLTDLFGEEKQQRFEEYTYSGVERHMVSSFLRGKIPAGSQLSETQEEQLIAALADERRRVEAEIRQRGVEPFLFPMEGVVFAFSGPGSENPDDRLKEAVDYNRRIHARAEAFLKPQQLEAFEQMQEAGIVGVRYWVRQQQRDNATRTATSGGSR